MGQKSTKVGGDLEAAGVGVPQLLRLLESIRLCNNTNDLPSAVHIITSETCNILSCDRATVFLVDNNREQLVITRAPGSDTPDIRIPWSTGLAGHVFQSGEPLNIPDAYADDRFNRDTDVATGYKTRSIMCCPIRDAEQRTVAVMQCINKLGAASVEGKAGDPVPFSSLDMLLMDHLQAQVGVLLRNALAKDQNRIEREKVEALLDIVRSLNAGMGTLPLVFTITNRTPALVNADRCTLYVMDRARGQLWSMQGAVEIRIPCDQGLAGAVAQSGEVLNIKDAYQDSRFNQEFDKKSGYRTKSILCMPLQVSPERGIIGVIQLINKMDGTGAGFTEQDERLLSGFLDIASSILEQSQLFQSQQVKLSEMDRIKGTGGKRSKGETKHTAMGGMSIAEGDEEEEEDEDEDED